MKRILWICVIVCLCFFFSGCRTTGTQSGYNPTFEKMRDGRWGGGW